MRSRRWGLAWLVGLALVIAACGGVTQEPTPTSTLAPVTPVIPASPTVDPVIPLAEGQTIRDPGLGDTGVSSATMAGLPAEGQPAEDAPTLTPGPTQAMLPMTISASDGLPLAATFYSPTIRPAPGVLLIPPRGHDRTAWDPLARALQAAGYAVLTVDLRGSGPSSGAEDWTLARDDVHAALRMLAELPGVGPGQIIAGGASVGANLALDACADLPGCVAAVLLSPGLDYRGITTPDALVRLGTRAVLIAASENDDNNPSDSIVLDGMAVGDHRLVIYPAAGHGTDMLTAQPDLVGLIVEWLRTHVAPPGG